MARKVFGVAALAALTGLLACGDPTGDLRNGAQKLSTDFVLVNVGLGKTTFITSSIVDEQGNPLPGAITATSNNPAAISVAEVDTFRQGVKDKLALQFAITGLVPDSGVITLTGAGHTDTVRVQVSPKNAIAGTMNGAPSGDTVTVSAAIGQVITLQAFGNIVFDNTTTVTFGTLQAVVTAIGPGGTSLSFIPVPGSGYLANPAPPALPGPAPVAATVNVALPYAPSLGRVSFTTSNVLTVPPVTSMPAVFSTATPNINDPVTVTAAGFKFLPNTQALYGGQYQTIDSISSDSNTVYMRASQSAAAGVVSFSNVALDFLTGAPLASIPSVNTLTVGATITPLAGTDAIATAPVISIPPAGKTTQLNDIGAGGFSSGADCSANPGGFPCRVYKLNLTGADVGVSATWTNDGDLGIYFTDAAGTDTGLHSCDNGGHGPSGHPETCTITGLTGTYYLYVNSFTSAYPPPNNVDPVSFTITLTGN